MALVVIGTHDQKPRPTVKPRHDAQALRSAADRVVTDLHMVLILSRKALTGDGLSPEVRAAVGEAFLLHVWSLREFFYGSLLSAQGVVAADYFTNATEWEAFRPPLPTSLDQDWHRCGGVVKPVSRVVPRSRDGDKKRPYSGFTADLQTVSRAFLEALPAEQASWFEGAA